MFTRAYYLLSDHFGLVLLACALAFVAWRVFSSDGGPTPVAVGTPLPPIEAEGWLNLAEGESFDPAGEIVVVDLWATWCGPCREDIPRMALIAAEYRPRGVKFVGFTQETAEDLERIEAFMKRIPGFDWPVGYGAIEVMKALDPPGIPTVVLFGRDGKARWSAHGTHGLQRELERVLGERPSKDESTAA